MSGAIRSLDTTEQADDHGIDQVYEKASVVMRLENGAVLTSKKR